MPYDVASDLLLNQLEDFNTLCMPLDSLSLATTNTINPLLSQSINKPEKC